MYMFVGYAFLHIGSAQFSLWHQLLLIYSVTLHQLARWYFWGERCRTWREGWTAQCPPAFPDSLFPTSPHRELLLPPALGNGEQSCPSSAKGNPTSERGFLLHNENWDFAESFSPWLPNLSPKVCTAGNQFSPAGKVKLKAGTDMTAHKTLRRLWKSSNKYSISFNLRVLFVNLCHA